MFKFLVGMIQSFFQIIIFKPDVVFIKGGYVGLPVGLVVAKCFKKISIILHDSDARPGLTNRILSKYAKKIAVGMPVEFSSYDKSKTEFVGIPIKDVFFKPLTKKSTKNKPQVFIIGGSQGSRIINEQIIKIASKFSKDADFLLISGQEKFDVVQKTASSISNLKVLPFISEEKISDYFKESEIVITRAGATTMAEISAVGTPTIIIPSPYLASDHQTKNAEMFVKSKAAFVVYENELNKNVLEKKIEILLNDQKLRNQFSKNIAKFAKPNAAKTMAEIIIGVENGKNSE